MSKRLQHCFFVFGRLVCKTRPTDSACWPMWTPCEVKKIDFSVSSPAFTWPKCQVCFCFLTLSRKLFICCVLWHHPHNSQDSLLSMKLLPLLSGYTHGTWVHRSKMVLLWISSDHVSHKSCVTLIFLANVNSCSRSLYLRVGLKTTDYRRPPQTNADYRRPPQTAPQTTTDRTANSTADHRRLPQTTADHRRTPQTTAVISDVVPC